MLKQSQKLEVGKHAFRPHMMSWVTLKALFFFLIVSCIWDLFSKQVVSSCYKGRDHILILLELLITPDLETSQNRIFLKTRWLISTISHVISLTSALPDVSDFMNLSLFFSAFGIILCAKSNVSVLCFLFFYTFEILSAYED